MIKLNIKLGDPLLDPFLHIINHRQEKCLLKELGFTDRISKLSDIFNNHLYFGLHQLENKSWVFREWAPNATAIYIIGESNEWNKRENFKLDRLDDGIWQVKLPADAVWHGMDYKLLVEWEGGSGVRIPSYAKQVIQDNIFKTFTTRVWAPENPYIWKNKFLPKQTNPLIYEAHIGMSMENRGVATFNEFRVHILPRVAELGYNTIQLMGIQEHPYYGSFGYQVSSFYAVSSRFGTPDDLKHLIDEAHGLGIGVVMDLVHSHSVQNEEEGLSNFAGDYSQYFYDGERGKHLLWGSRCFDYSKHEVIKFLLSNCKYWAEEFNFDGFRFDGITSMLYLDHGIERDFTEYKFYYDENQDEDAIVYLTLANKLIHEINLSAITIAEDMSGMPGLGTTTEDGGIGFDFKMSMGVPDYWIKLIKDLKDEQWHVGDIFYEMTNKRAEEHTISYVESHDQAMVGDKTVFFRLVDKEIYTGMDIFNNSIVIDRGIALHKMIRLLTIATAGDGYLNFMGNEFGHPEWIDFPREGNNWSYQYARRQWSLVDDKNLKFRFLKDFDKTMISTIKNRDFFANAPEPIVRDIEKQILVFKRGNYLFAFNFNSKNSYTDYEFDVDPGKYLTVLNTDSKEFNGFDRVDSSQEHFTNFKNGHNLLSLYIPARVGIVLHLEQ